MRRAVCAVALHAAAAAGAAAVCGPSDDPGDCAALTAFGDATGYKKWAKNTGWLEKGRSVCGWHGVNCTGGRVTGIDLRKNGLSGSIPEAVGGLTALESLEVQGSRPADYGTVGPLCSENDFGRAPLPRALFTLAKLTDLDLEYTCTGGTLPPEVGDLTSMQSLQLHGNYISGTIPTEMGRMTDIRTFKLGRNPFTGTLPAFTTFAKVVQWNCNFCALTGTFPDVFHTMPSLTTTYWDGNGFTGTIPASIAAATRVSRLSFNINAFTGKIPDGICGIPAGNGPDTPDVDHDCRIGGDTDLGQYQANYSWMLPVPGNAYDCPVPACARVGSCNKTQGKKVVNPLSPVRCAA